MLIVGCAVAGLGIRASPLIVPVYIAETEITSQGGDMLGFWINCACDLLVQGRPVDRSPWPAARPRCPPSLGHAEMPESLRWLANHDRWERQKVFVGLRALPADPNTSEASSPRSTTPFQRGNRVSVGMLLLVCQNFPGVNIITYYSPRIFETLGLAGTITRLFAAGL
ncbi:sugar transporter domain-containing protein [Hirsutella rhossiliensis]|uniref:Sugar transporter domain-containing protein n=1 Tax=Hirsutella rhossiliensis TaxID=111463 RepID=A0A9P8SHB8_9HYPO|nr:sugar transporter domain-containing protein [Hirsutella rhossiliensis]KAH0961370.1 sugar transporter domain-containing protein [Hirsutella rhossiliensis]